MDFDALKDLDFNIPELLLHRFVKHIFLCGYCNGFLLP